MRSVWTRWVGCFDREMLEDEHMASVKKRLYRATIGVNMFDMVAVVVVVGVAVAGVAARGRSQSIGHQQSGGGERRNRSRTVSKEREGGAVEEESLDGASTEERKRGKREGICVQRSRLFFVLLFDDAHYPGWLRKKTGLLV